MKLVISDDSGETVGELYTRPESMWIDLLMYVSQRWEDEAAERQGHALELVLAGHHADPA